MLALFLASLAFADSPLTSTQLHAGYPEDRVIQQVLEKRTLDDKLAKYLSDPRLDHGLRVATIHALGWTFKGQENASVYLAWLEKKYKRATPQQIFAGEGLKPEEKLVLGLLLATDDYFDPQRALPLLEAAKTELRPSRAVASAVALVQAQAQMETSWCEVWRTWEAVTLDTTLKDDLAPESVAQLHAYLQLYEQDCPPPIDPEAPVDPNRMTPEGAPVGRE